MMRLSKPIDIIDLAYRSRFTELVERDGVVLYVSQCLDLGL
jgi:hypothetical protein